MYSIICTLTPDESSYHLVAESDGKAKTIKAYCLDASLVISKIMEAKPKSLIFTSGSLALGSSFGGIERQLGIEFETKLVGKHVVERRQIAPIYFEGAHELTLDNR